MQSVKQTKLMLAFRVQTRLLAVLLLGCWLGPPHLAGETLPGAAAEKNKRNSMQIKKYWDLSYVLSPSDASQTQLRGDLFVPVLAGDTIVVRATPPGPKDKDAPICLTGMPRPAIIVVHGGAWVAGDKWTLGRYSESLAKLGVCVLNVNYRLAPRHPFPAQVDDVRAALLYLKQHASELCIDVDRIGLFGYSAGGHLCTLIGTLSDEPITTQQQASDWETDDPRWAELPTVAAVCAGGPPTDFQTLPLDSNTFSFFLGASRREAPNLYRAASPIAHVSPNDPPMKMVHGENDLLVPISTSRSMVAALQKVGAKASLQVIPGQGHLVTLMHPLTEKTVSHFFQQQFLSENQ